MNPAWTVRVGRTRHKEATIRGRLHSTEIGQSLDFGASASAISSIEVFLGTIGADVLLRFCEICERRQYPIDEIELRVTGSLGNALVALDVVGEEGDPGLAHASITATVTGPTKSDLFQQAWQDALKHSPVFTTLCRAATIENEIRIL